ncbi:hypothetical protein Ciccas_012097 [Cichlidogyrus casuarinus]|uniref:Uncharacterized protein n=1 Tax=Cichlidogyrus casuarinus TaxID=1844966 RepID=A0ABD2PQM8_9PLAT
MFVAIPCKKPVMLDMVSPLLRYVKDNCTAATNNTCRGPIEELNSLRNKIAAAISHNNDSTANLLKQYFY